MTQKGTPYPPYQLFTITGSR